VLENVVPQKLERVTRLGFVGKAAYATQQFGSLQFGNVFLGLSFSDPDFGTQGLHRWVATPILTRIPGQPAPSKLGSGADRFTASEPSGM